eukprot:tig00020562_g11160.t1
MPPAGVAQVVDETEKRLREDERKVIEHMKDVLSSGTLLCKLKREDDVKKLEMAARSLLRTLYANYVERQALIALKHEFGMALPKAEDVDLEKHLEAKMDEERAKLGDVEAWVESHEKYKEFRRNAMPRAEDEEEELVTASQVIVTKCPLCSQQMAAERDPVKNACTHCYCRPCIMDYVKRAKLNKKPSAACPFAGCKSAVVVEQFTEATEVIAELNYQNRQPRRSAADVEDLDEGVEPEELD